MKRSTGESVVYTSCATSGCGQGGCCMLKAHVQNGVITAIESGDPINRGMPREDVTQDILMKQMIQHRPCTRAYTWRRTIYHPDRALHPMKRVGERGERKFERISWEEALDTIAGKIREIGEKYGPNCIMGDLPVVQWAGPWSFRTWGNSSYGGFVLSEMVTLGYNMGHSATIPEGGKWAEDDREMQESSDIFNTKLVLWFGANPAVIEHEAAYWLSLARERGIPIIFVDPVYTVSAEAYADQWIPIRAGTDLAMLLAMANVLFKENLYDTKYVTRFVEPDGFRKWQDYVTGRTAGPDGKADRTPEWAEKICGVPAETIRQIARLYAGSRPCNFRLRESAVRQACGENSGRAALYLQAMTGNLGVAGGSPGSEITLGHKMIIPYPAVDWKNAPPRFPSQRIMWQRGWMDSILLREKLNTREMDEDEYRRRCGIARDWPLPNIHMVWFSSQPTFKYRRMSTHRSGRPGLGNENLNRLSEALKKVDFIVSPVYFMSAFPTMFADIVLPLADPFFEEARGFLAATGDTSNHFICGFKVVEPPGEARPLEWINVQLARRLGVVGQYSPRLADAADDYPEGWDRRIEELLKEAYETWAARDDIAPKGPPPWPEFRKLPIYRVPYEQRPHVPFANNIEKGKPFDTPSGKIEFHSAFLADPEMARKSLVLPRSKVDNQCCFGGSVPPVIPPMAEWVLPWNSMLAPKAAKYPLTMLTSRSYHRNHTSQDNNPWVRDELRHSIHISVADARGRGIKDGDTVRVFNETGEVLMLAFVTSRMTPGMVVIPHGAWPELTGAKTRLMPGGIDRRGADNFLTSSESYPWVVGPERCAELVQVERFGGNI